MRYARLLLSASYSESSSAQNTTNVDKRVTTESGSILSLADNNLTVNEGGQLTVVNNDPATAMKAIEAVGQSSDNLVSAIANTAKQLTSNSNDIASKVVDAQQNFVEAASGQKAVMWTVAIVGGVAMFVMLPLVVRSMRK